MKITCPKCLAAYRIDLPDTGEAGIDVQCGKCQHIFLFSPDLEKPDPSEPILPPQKDEDQEVSDSKKPPLQPKKQAPPSPEEDREILEELEMEPSADDPEPIEIVVEDETPVDSLEEESLDNIWDQAMQEGARTVDKSKEKSPPQPSEKPVAETIREEILEETLPSSKEKSDLSPSLEDRKREVDQIIKDHQAQQIKSEENLLIEESSSSLSQKNSQQEKTQEEIDLEEQVTIKEGESIPSWEEAFARQAELEAGWNKAQEKDRAQEEEQLAEALSDEHTSPESASKNPPAVTEDTQAMVDNIFAQIKSPAQSTDQPPAQETPTSFSADAGTTAENESEPTWNEAEEQEDSSEAATPSEEKESAPPDPMNMKQLVKQAFKEESEQTAEAPILEEVETPALEEATPEPELTLELESTPETPVAEETPPVPQDEEDINQTIDYYASYIDSPDTPEMEPALEITLESADTDVPEMEPIPEMTLESADTDVPEMEPIPEMTLESADTDVPEMEPIPEMTLESADTGATDEEEHEPIWTDAFDHTEIEDTREELEEAEEQPAMNLGRSLDEENKELWADLLPEHNEEEPPVHEEAPVAAFDGGEEEENSLGGSDFWDQVLEKDSQESQTADTEAEPEPVSSVPVAQDQDTSEREALTDEELWQQAFPGEENFEPATSQDSGEEEEEHSQTSLPPLVIGADVNLDEESEDSLKYDEAAYADYDDDDDDEFEFQRRKRNLGPFTIPHGRRGDLVIGGALVVFLLLAGSAYFILQTFAPGELTEDIQTAKTDVPEGLSPREVPLDELAGDLTTPKPEKPEKTPTVDTPGDKGEAILSDPVRILEEAPEEKGILKDLAESQILKDTGETQTAKVDESASQAITGHSVTMSTIMPVAYNPTDIRVLSFSVEIQLSNAQSAKMVRESMPVYEKIMNQTVEDLLRRKFYNDILYVKEKLQKRLQTAMNKSLKNGRVRTAKFTDFAIQ